VYWCERESGFLCSRGNGLKCNRQWYRGCVKFSNVVWSSTSYHEPWRAPASAIQDKVSGQRSWLVYRACTPKQGNFALCQMTAVFSDTDITVQHKLRSCSADHDNSNIRPAHKKVWASQIELSEICGSVDSSCCFRYTGTITVSRSCSTVLVYCCFVMSLVLSLSWLYATSILAWMLLVG